MKRPVSRYPHHVQGDRSSVGRIESVVRRSNTMSGPIRRADCRGTLRGKHLGDHHVESSPVAGEVVRRAAVSVAETARMRCYRAPTSDRRGCVSRRSSLQRLFPDNRRQNGSFAELAVVESDDRIGRRLAADQTLSLGRGAEYHRSTLGHGRSPVNRTLS